MTATIKPAGRALKEFQPLLWFEILFGWVSSLLVAVVFSLTRRREE